MKSNRFQRFKSFLTKDLTPKSPSYTAPLLSPNPCYSDSFRRHPFITSAVVCFAICILTFCKQSYISEQSILIISSLCFAAMCFCFSHFCKSEKILKYKLSIYVLFAILAVAFGILLLHMTIKADIICLLGIVTCIIIFIYWLVNKRLTTEKLVLLIFVCGFLLRLAYVLYTSISTRQHDVGTFGSGSYYGHASYIEYLYTNLSLPDFDVREAWQFYHPPLHHAIAALWLKFMTAFGVAYEYACESIQVLTLFYSTCCMILSCKIFKALSLRGTGLVVAFAIIAFHPTFIILSGSINNDILSITFMLGAVLNTIYWYKDHTMKNILQIALCVGLGMMTKLSVWMVAPAVAVIFIIVFFSHLKQWKKFIGQFAAFLGVCAPLGLWWPIRNFILWGVPLSYVPMLSDTSNQYIGFHSIIERLFDFNFSQFEWVYMQFEFYGGTYYEYNPLIALLKSAMFAENINDSFCPAISTIGPILFWLGTALAVISFAAMIFFLIKKNVRNDPNIKVFLFVLYFVTLASYYIFCLTYQHTCTQDIRYAVILIVLGAFFVGTIPTLLRGKRLYQRILRISLYCLTGMFCASSAITYLLVGSVGWYIIT